MKHQGRSAKVAKLLTRVGLCKSGAGTQPFLLNLPVACGFLFGFAEEWGSRWQGLENLRLDFRFLLVLTVTGTIAKSEIQI